MEGAERNAAHTAVVQFVHHGISYAGIAQDRRRAVGYLAQLADAGFTRIFDVDAMRETSAAELKDRYKGLSRAKKQQLILNLYCWRAERTECVPPGA